MCCGSISDWSTATLPRLTQLSCDGRLRPNHQVTVLIIPLTTFPPGTYSILSDIVDFHAQIFNIYVTSRNRWSQYHRHFCG